MKDSISRLGYHYYPDDLHYTDNDAARWIPVLKEMGANWLVLKSSADRAIPEYFLEQVLAAGIEPVIHIPATAGTRLRDVDSLLSSYANWGIRYVVVYDRPNLRINWRDQEWTRGRLVERFMDFMLPILERQMELGLIPILPPLEPGGDYWDTVFLESALHILQRRAKPQLIDKLVLGVYAWTNDLPLDWGKGGPDSWPETHPYHTPPNGQDQCGLNIFDWYEAICQANLGKALPMLTLAGGAVVDQASEMSLSHQAEQNIAILRMLKSEELSPHVLGFAFYCLTANGNNGTSMGWFNEDGSNLPVVDLFQRLIDQSDLMSAHYSSYPDADDVSEGIFKGLPHSEINQNSMPNLPAGKRLRHYVLLPSSVELEKLWDWETFGEFIRTARPAIGFSADEAKIASRVTLIGNENIFPTDLENSLIQTGCIVSRLDLTMVTDNEGPASYTPSAGMPTPVTGAAHG